MKLATFFALFLFALAACAPQPIQQVVSLTETPASPTQPPVQENQLLATHTVVPTVTPTSGPPYEIESRLFPYPDFPNAWHATGKILNNTDAYLMGAEILIKIPGQSDNDITRTLPVGNFLPIPPHGTGYFDSFRLTSSEISETSVPEVTLANLVVDPDYKPVELEFTNILDQSMGPYQFVSGFVVNPGPGVIGNLDIRVVFFDRNGFPIRTSSGNITVLWTLAPGEQSAFRAIVPSGTFSYKITSSAKVVTEDLTLYQPADVEFSDWNYFQDSDYGYFHLLGRVTNHTSRIIILHTGAALLDGDGHVLDIVINSQTYPGILLPGENAVISFGQWYFNQPEQSAKVIGYATQASSLSSERELLALQISDIRLVAAQAQSGNGNVLEIAGYAYNPHSENLSNCKVAIEIYQKSNGKLWGAGGMQFSTVINSKSSAAFSAQLPKPQEVDISQLSYRIKGSCLK